jgi:polysaccharide biosynthesis/export protein
LDEELFMRLLRTRSTGFLRQAALWLLPAMLAVMSGCAGSSRQMLNREMVLPFTDEQFEAVEQAESAPYLLQRGDVFAIETLIAEELRQPGILVLPDGTATLIHLGNMKVAGLTVSELEEKINAAFSRDFRDVRLNVVLHEIAGRKVYVLGEVEQPGLYDIGREGIGIMGAIALAGGFTDYSAQGSVVILRLTPQGYLSRELNLAALRKGRAFDTAALDLQPYDIIYVNRSKIGDFAAFTQGLVGSLTQYSRIILDIRQIENPEFYRR